MRSAALLVLGCCLGMGTGFTSSPDTDRKSRYQIQNGPCSYTFLLPEQDNCQAAAGTDGNLAQKDDPADYESVQRLEQLENIMENNTQWLLKLENYIQENMKHEMAQIQQHAVHNHTAAIIEIGTSLLSQTVEQTLKLTNVEAQVINHTTRLQLQLHENSLSTTKLEKQIILQTNEISKLTEKNSFMEKRVEELEEKRQAELKVLQEEKEQLKQLVQRQTSVMQELEQQLLHASSNNSALQLQQQELLETVNNLIFTMSLPTVGKSAMMQDTPTLYKDCAAVLKSGSTNSGAYSLNPPASTQQIKAYCDMETEGGGWTVFQRRFDGHVDFHRTWKEYKAGFGDVSGEHWLGNEFIAQLTKDKPYVLRVELKDWEGNSAYSQYDEFSISDEAKNYRIHLKGYSGTAGKISSLGQPGSDFSTKDADNDKCVCKCSQLTTGGWWFDACGPSNLNGIYYQLGQNTNRFNGIKWYYWKGSGYSLKATTLMIRPADF
ncbi:angiopoietin-2a isoform X1 [Denticeps clupeoides]|uniref:angiopoietin-2a isoform X1 n=2 Tax=Denticeps clupeoides TaxID=299321 RepID=UPI0010A2E017|nr:angiopoietin-2 isoform X1 [Denticeps clupeoides]